MICQSCKDARHKDCGLNDCFCQHRERGVYVQRKDDD